LSKKPWKQNDIALELYQMYNETHNRISAMDGTRGFAILYVIILHVSHGITGSFFSEGLHNVLLRGTFGVPLFFCISGFLIYASYERSILKKKSPKKDFYFRRAIRILPLWWLTVLSYFLLDLISGRQALAYATFFFGFDFASYAYIYVSWSLFTEEIFYIFLPFIYKQVKKPWTTVQYYIFTLLISIFIHSAFSISGTNSLLYMYLFFMGILIYHGDISMKFSSVIRKSFGMRYLKVIDVAALFVLLAPFNNVSFGLELGVPIVFFAMMYGDGVFNKLVNTKFLKIQGEICFSLYLIHPLMIYFLLPYRDGFLTLLKLDKSFGEIQFLVLFPFVWGSTFVAGYATYRLIEKPCIDFGKNRLDSGKNSETLSQILSAK
jgi:peptidoglycan/LPS O-acetylase OafA/YrhL